eukprot:6358999-Amphidinium_carterae.1
MELSLHVALMRNGNCKTTYRDIRGGHLTKSKHCRACILGSCPMKYHRALHEDDRMSHCLHVDLVGPFSQSVDCYTYFMVGVLRLPDYPLIFQVKLLETRSAPEVAQALSGRINLIEALEFEGFPIGERRVRRVHTDRARELTSSFLETFLTRYPQLLHTHTKSNGTAERGVGMVKTHSKLPSHGPSEFWSFAALYAAQSLLCKALQRKQRSPLFGSSVIARRLKPATRIGTKHGIIE